MLKPSFIYGLLSALFFLWISPLASKAQSKGTNARHDSLLTALAAKKHQDSLTRQANKARLQNFRDSLNIVRSNKRKADSLIKEQQKIGILARKTRADSLRLARLEKDKKRKAREKYKTSRHYRDSVDMVHRHVQDSISQARTVRMNAQRTRAQQVKDSMVAVRTHTNDSLKTIRQHVSDSTKAAVQSNMDQQKAIRQKRNDSLADIRKHRSDSLAAVKKTKAPGDLAKQDQKKKALTVQMLHEKKAEEWTNDKLLKRKWTMTRRIYQNTVTRYNYYYNAHKKYEEAIKNLKKNHKEDYSKLISLYPYDTRKSGSSVAGEMDSVIKKSSFSTQIHDPRSKWFDNLYFMMGKASYVKNDFDGAITTFQFVANEYKDNPAKKKATATVGKNKKDEKPDASSIASKDNRRGIHYFNHHPIRNQALIWLAKSYIQAEQYSEAAALISTLEKDKVFPKWNKADLYMTKASLNIQQKNYGDAITSLEQSLTYKLPSVQKARNQFLIGQLYELQEDYARSSEHFKKSISGKSNPEMDFYTKLKIAQNAARGGGDKAFAIHQLEKLIGDSKFERYRSQAYLALAGIYYDDDADKAIEILHKSLKHMDNKNPLQKASTFALLGKLYYSKAQYELAKTAYDSASHYGTNPPLENLNEVNTRKEVLTEVVRNIKIIHRQDSLLALSMLSDKEQKAIARKEADRLRKAEEQKKNALNATQVVALTPGNISAAKSNWYFYNSALMEKGASDFKQKWGSRKLEDNWRRIAVNSNAFALAPDSSAKEENKLLVNGSQYETLLAEIPKTQAKRDKANDLIMNAYYDLGLIYYAQLKDYPNSISCFDSLLLRYPKTNNKKQSYYALFLDHHLLKQDSEADRYKKLLQDEFGQSEFAKLANNPNYFDELKQSSRSLDQYYDSTYQCYLDTQYVQALARITYARNQLHPAKLMAKFDLLEGLCYARQKEYATCKTSLQDVIQHYPATPEQKRAEELLGYLKSNNLLPADSTAGTSRQTKDTTSVKLSEVQVAKGTGLYTYKASSPHLFLVYLHKIDGRTLALKTAFSDFNKLKHETEELKTGQNLFSVKEGVLTVSSFSNSVFAKIFMNDIEKDPSLFKAFKPEEYDRLLISAENFTELLKTRDILGYLEFYAKNYR